MKEKIIIKATELFLSIGFKSVTMDDLAQSMGISKKTIYQFFKNKNHLISLCMKTLQKGVVKSFKQISINANICNKTIIARIWKIIYCAFQTINNFNFKSFIQKFIKSLRVENLI